MHLRQMAGGRQVPFHCPWRIAARSPSNVHRVTFASQFLLDFSNVQDSKNKASLSFSAVLILTRRDNSPNLSVVAMLGLRFRAAGGVVGLLLSEGLVFHGDGLTYGGRERNGRAEM